MAELKPRPRRKLNRAQIAEILERNVQLYKGEESFVHYLIDLALYLLEYEYDWSQSGTDPRQNTTGSGNTTGNKTDPEKAAPRVVSIQSNSSSLKPLRRTCPYCGSLVGDALECPSCHNLTR
ncbi:hypothetical protein LLG95_10815 [bacterium]|nr:hypothetical protein [bacterium]